MVDCFQYSEKCFNAIYPLPKNELQLWKYLLSIANFSNLLSWIISYILHRVGNNVIPLQLSSLLALALLPLNKGKIIPISMDLQTTEFSKNCQYTWNNNLHSEGPTQRVCL